MAEDPEVMDVNFLIARTMARFAQARGWNDSQYGIYYRTNPDWGRIHFLFAEGFNDRDDHECTREVWAHLERELQDEPDVLKSINLVVRSKKKVEEGGLYAIGSRYQRLWTITPVSHES